MTSSVKTMTYVRHSYQMNVIEAISAAGASPRSTRGLCSRLGGLGRKRAGSREMLVDLFVFLRAQAEASRK